MAEDFWFEPETEETSFLNSVPINAPVRTEVRIAYNVYRNEENGYSVYNVEDGDHHWFKINGYFPAPMKIDGYYTVEGVIKEGRYGRTLQVVTYKSALPQTEDGIITVLRTLPRLDTRAPFVYQELGEHALDMILEHPDEVANRVKWVGLKMALAWQETLRSLKESDVILQTLQDYQIPAKAAKQLLEKYPDIIDRLKKSPYFLAEEVRGFSFIKCDKIALENDYPLNGQERLQQAILYVLNQVGQARGDCFLPKEEFLGRVRKIIDIRIDFRTARSLLAKGGPVTIQYGKHCVSVERDALQKALHDWQKASKKEPFSFACEKVGDADLTLAIDSMRSLNRIIVEEGRVYLGNLYNAEVTVANCLKAMVASEYGYFQDVEEVLNDICIAEGVVLEEKQREAALRICLCRGGVFVLNGRAGCGKTFTLNIIIKVLKELYRRQGLYFSAEIMAPTGKAAQVAHKSTKLSACTVHRALHLVADQNNASETTITGECVVVDEFSMMGLGLTASLMRAIAPGVKLIIMGDYEQLPSIDPGNVLRDIIASGAVPVITLNVVKRQAEGSGVLYNANEILDGRMIHSKIVDKSKVKNNAYIFKAPSPAACRTTIVQMILKLRKKGVPMDDIQVLCPQKKTDVGIDAMNYFIQEAINPAKGGKELLSKLIEVTTPSGETQSVKLMFREGDKVIHTANNYEMRYYNFRKGEGFVEDFSCVGIVNGETGRIAKILEVKEGKATHQRIYVRYGPDKYAMYEDDWSDLSMAYAMTIHRAQGSQWPVVIAPILFCNKGMLNRKLFYTLYTRAQDTTMIYGTAEAVEFAIKNNMTASRYTWLEQRLAAG